MIQETTDIRQLCFIQRKMEHRKGHSMQTSHIMLVDDHPLVRSGYRHLIESEPDLCVCCEAATIDQALELVYQYSPDLAIIDLSLPDGNGLDLIRRLRARYPSILILVSSMHDEDLFAERALHAGAMGYINKQEAGEQVIHALRRILDGKVYLSPSMTERQALEPSNNTGDPNHSIMARLSNREIEVFDLIGRGLSTSQIAARLNLSVKTIESHFANIKTKLGINSAGELMRSAISWSLGRY